MTLEEIFLAAVEKDPTDRAVYLDAACGSDAELRAQVEALLRSHEEAGSLLEQPLFQPGPTVDQPSAAEQIGAVIGPYKLLEQIGEGGMGAVYMAHQAGSVKRLVALKLIKPGMDSRQVVARFEAERQALALMDHPNIARVFDAGSTASGRPYFVMELVKGVPLTKCCDERRLTPRERLELFIPVCQAIQHAHQKGIIHRDIKPSNVLVALYDGKPVPKVIDFGVAKATGQQLTEQTLVTGFGAVVGTLEYMSPEQAEVNQLDIDTRSDIYSLGVMLYELLTGSTPLESNQLKQASLLELLRLIREQEPARPSTRLSDCRDSLASVSAQRNTEPAKLTKLMRGELDWIVMKALEKDRNRRYETANGFAADVQRYLDDEPVQACPPSAGYRLRKFARRNKTALATFAAITLALLVGTGISIWQAVDANDARGLADERLKSEEHARAQAQTSFQKALEAVERMLHQLGDETMAAFPQLKEARQRLLEDALTLYTDLIALNPSNSMAYFKRGDLYHTVLGKAKEARSDYEKAIELDPENAQAHAMLADLLLGETQALPGVTTPELGLWHAKRAVELQPTDAGLRANLGYCYRGTNQKAAVAAFTKAAELCNPGSAEGYFNQANADILNGNLRSALVNLKRCLAQGPNGTHYMFLGGVHQSLGETEQALAAFTKAIELPGMSSRNRGGCYVQRGNIYLSQKKYEAALSDYNMLLALHPSFSSGASRVHLQKGSILAQLGRFQQALAELTKALELIHNYGNGFFDFGELAASFPDEGFRKGLLWLADKMGVQLLLGWEIGVSVW